MIDRLRRGGSFYSIAELLNDTIRLSNHESKGQLIWSRESKYHPDFGTIRESDIVGDRLSLPSLIMSFVILGSVIVAVIAVYIKYLIMERQFKRQSEAEFERFRREFPECEDLDAARRLIQERRGSILNTFKEFRL